MLNIEPQIEKIVFTFLQENTINEMVQTNSHQFITGLLAPSRIIAKYFNHLLLYYFTTSPLKIDEPLSTFQFCHSWLGTSGN